jgi:hypothetical protein
VDKRNVSATFFAQKLQFYTERLLFRYLIVIPSGMYTNYSKWIQKEIDGAKLYNKPILAVNPWGQQKRAGLVLNNADYGVGWNKGPVISGIWDLYCNNR